MSKYFYVYRDSVTGQFVSADYAAKNPKTTQRERRLRRA